ncbi:MULTISPECIES: gamma-glutamylcyclotransferase [unclassified Ensifer]|uniref:gamma-glutamylcyclotransferase n=1 Tax=unclassified Ensifer TaxID=2633371 RepID=UPI000ACEFF0A|nr:MULTISPECIES: gamma-glutamylcyclotransferase [unclassified Ensifer]
MLTSELVACVQRFEPDPGVQPGTVPLAEEDYESILGCLLATRPLGPLWLFAYGSLIWKPEVTHAEERVATAPGWHRAFCLKLLRWRGTPERPGLMMALDRGGSCKGVIYRLPEEGLREQLSKLLRREMSVKWLPDGGRPVTTNAVRWISVTCGKEAISAVAFVANPNGGAYAGKLGLEDVARTLATAAGHWGSCAEYLRNTVIHLESRGIRDGNLWRLQKLVAAEIATSRKTGRLRSNPGRHTER